MQLNKESSELSNTSVPTLSSMNKNKIGLSRTAEIFRLESKGGGESFDDLFRY